MFSDIMDDYYAKDAALYKTRSAMLRRLSALQRENAGHTESFLGVSPEACMTDRIRGLADSK